MEWYYKYFDLSISNQSAKAQFPSLPLTGLMDDLMTCHRVHPVVQREAQSCSWSQSSLNDRSLRIVSAQPSKWKHQIEPLVTLISMSQSFVGKCRGTQIDNLWSVIWNSQHFAFLFADFDDMSCQMIFGQDPPGDDPVLRQPCYKLCNSLTHKPLILTIYISLYKSPHFFISRVVNLFFYVT